MAVQKESLVVNKIKDYMIKQGAWGFKYHGGALSKVGVPDLIFCFKGRFVGIEVKQGNGKPSKIQLHQIELIKQAGGIAFVAWSLEGVLEELEKEGLLNGEN